MTTPNHLSHPGCKKLGRVVRTKQGGPRGRAGWSFLSRQGANRQGEHRFKLPGICAAFLNLPPGSPTAVCVSRSKPRALRPPAKASDGSRGMSPGRSHVSTLGVGRGAGSRGVVETVFTERLGISRAADDDAATEEAEGRADPARVQGVAKTHNGGLAVGADGKPDRGNDTAHGWGEMERKGNSST